MSLFQKLTEEDPSKYPARMGKKWEKEEVDKLLSSIQKKKSIKDIAKEHERTIGAINAERRKLAADYWFNDKRPIEEIVTITGLTKEEIEDVIKRRSENKNMTTTGKSPKSKEPPTDMKEVISLLKDIKSMLSLIVERTA